ncbi:MAG: fatty acid desaturase, partial [Candidatus Methylumidiphilus sp.]
LLAGIAIQFGWLAALLFLYPAWAAVRMLEAVNYIQHYGLQRSAAKFGPADAWATDSWFTLHTFIGLSRHADHHISAGQPYARLRHCAESPRLPHGYFVSVLHVRLSNSGFLRAAHRELAARGLGPFRPPQRGGNA